MSEPTLLDLDKALEDQITKSLNAENGVAARPKDAVKEKKVEPKR